MATFTLTNPRARGQTDPNLVPQTPGPSWFEKAEVAWIDAQLHAHDIEDCRRRLALLRQRIENGRRWLDENEDADDEGRTLYTTLLNMERDEEVLLAMLRRACWNHCLVTYACLSHCPDRQTAAARLGVAYQLHEPQTVWHTLFPDEPPPGRWPVAKEEAYVGRAVKAVETWAREERMDALERRRNR